MPRHDTSLGAGNFPAASKLLRRYEQDKAYKLHQQKLSSMRHRLDTETPKKHNHLLLRLKQVQKDEERQAQIDYENKLLLTKMTTIMKYGGNLDNYNNYELRSLNYPHRNRVNDEILRENIGIAKRLETVKPKYRIDKWEKEYQQHSYLKRLWNDSVKDFGQFTPRRLSRMSKAVKRSMDDSLDDGYQEDFESVATSDDKRKLPKLGGRYKGNLRSTQSEADGPVTRKGGTQYGGTKLPKIVPHKQRIQRIKKSGDSVKKENGESKHGSKRKNEELNNSPRNVDSTKSVLQSDKPRKREKSDNSNVKDSRKSEKTSERHSEVNKNELKPKNDKLAAKSLTSVQSVNVAGNDIENVKTLISEDNENQEEESKDVLESNKDINDIGDTKQQVAGSETETDQSKDVSSEGKDAPNDKDIPKDNSVVEQKECQSAKEKPSREQTISQDNISDKDPEAKQEKDLADLQERENETHKAKISSNTSESASNSHSDDHESSNNDLEGKLQSDQEQTADGNVSEKSKEAKRKSYDKNMASPKKDQKANKKSTKKMSKEDGTSGNTGKEDTTDIAQLFKIAKQLEAPLEPGRPEDIFIKTLIKKSHKQRMTTKAKFRQKYDLDLISELKTGLGLQWELLIKELLEDRGFADAMAVFDAMCDLEGKKTQDVSDVVLVLCTRNNAAMADLKESYRKEFSLSLEEDILDRTQVPVQSLLLALQKGERDESDEDDLVLGHNDAVALYESGEGRWTSENGMFLKLVQERSPTHMQSVLNEYKTVSGGEELLDVMKQECPKDYFLSVKTYVNCTRSPTTYFADQLHSNKLPSNPVFVSTLVARSEIDMPAVRKAYKKKYKVDLVEEIKEFSYPTTKCLMELAAKVPPSKKDNQVKKTYTKVQHTQQVQQSTNQPQSTAKKSVAKKSETATVAKAVPSPASKETQVKDHSHQATKSKVDMDNQAAKAAAKPKEKETVINNGTVKPESNLTFNAEVDCDRLNLAINSGEGADESVVVAILPKRSNKQRQLIKKIYEQKYMKNLMIDLESELQGDMEEIVFALLMTPTEYDAYCVQKAVEEMGTSEPTLIGILCTRSSKELKEIKDYYRKAYKSDMDKDISGDCRGDFGDLIMELVKGERESGSALNKEQAQQDARELYKDGSIDLNGEVFKTLVTKKNHAQISATYTEYEKLAGHDIYTDISTSMQDEEGYLAVAKAVGDRVLFYTEAIKSCFTSTGTNDNMLIRTIVPRSEIDLLDIKAKYVELCSKGLWDDVNRDVRGDYKNLLLAIIQNDSKKKTKQVTNQKAKKEQEPAGPTVKPVNPFEPATDCKRLYEAMDGFGTNEDVIIDIIPHRSNAQRQEIKEHYEQEYGKRLKDELESELNGDFEEIVLALMMTPTEYDAYCLHDAVKGIGTTESVLIGILCTRTAQELTAIKQKYKEAYGQELEDAIAEDTSGALKDMLVELSYGKRDQSKTVNSQQAQTAALKLYKDGQISIDPDDDTFKEILVKQNRPQVRATFEEYKKLCGNDIYYGIEKAFIGDSEQAYKGLAKAVEDPIQFYSERLFACMKGVGTNDKMLIRIIVSRSEVDLEDIKIRYKSLYKQPLEQDIKSECNGDYKKILLAIIGST